jgi:hypothetical protein
MESISLAALPRNVDEESEEKPNASDDPEEEPIADEKSRTSRASSPDHVELDSDSGNWEAKDDFINELFGASDGERGMVRIPTEFDNAFFGLDD